MTATSVPLPKAGLAVDCQQVNVFDNHIVFDDVVGDVAFDLVDIDVVANETVVNGGVGDSRWPGKAAAKSDVFLEQPQPDIA